QALLHYLQLASKAQLQPIADGKPLKPGGHDTRIAQIRASLIASGIIAPQQQPTATPSSAGASHAAQAASPARYTADLVAGVKKVQAEWGLKPDGVIGAATVDVLNAGPAYRARQLAIAMERLRWLPRNPPGTRIDVN